jgi:hypothetical protein
MIVTFKPDPVVVDLEELGAGAVSCGSHTEPPFHASSYDDLDRRHDLTFAGITLTNGEHYSLESWEAEAALGILFANPRFGAEA